MQFFSTLDLTFQVKTKNQKKKKLTNRIGTRKVWLILVIPVSKDFFGNSDRINASATLYLINMMSDEQTPPRHHM